ncbi:insulinase family protein [Chlamydia trachomatis]|uniref:Protease 3 n=2 Tax=Chlamydia trachomatis TaxID=813 RepID=A0A0H2X3B3_CHLTA|nr:insulinase family protein [Chlamydia trachomatis]AAX51087.1 insulin-degrading enzyme [Chlamydia trachomatis A/HAR-13]CAX11266.1 exported insulinase/protease [Chlamydia trachomatis B/Jali20/OT]
MDNHPPVINDPTNDPKNMKRSLSLLLLCIPSFLTACSKSFQTIRDENPLTILTPALADQKIAKILCPNGLSIMIVSSPHAAESGAALVVKTGNNADPVEFPGLAHFTEHCVFLGNEKYPEPSGFPAFLSTHGGIYNAFTYPDKTCFLFSVNNADLDNALDQFVHLFIQPLFRQEDLNKEVHAVEQEFAMHPTKDSRRMHRIQQLIAPKNHPLKRFGCGNLSTLNSVTTQDMQTWFATHYSPENMAAIVYTTAPLDTAVPYIASLFSEIPISAQYTPQKPFPKTQDTTALNKLFINKAVEPSPQLAIYWHFYDAPQSLQGWAQSLISILSSEKENSLVALLKKEQLITEMEAELYSTSHNTQDFEILYKLTNKGEREYQRVLQLTFAFLDYVRHERLPAYSLPEIQKINSLEYTYSTQTELFSTLSRMVPNFTSEPLATYPYRSLVYPEYSQEDEQTFATFLADPQQARYILSATLPSSWENADEFYDPIFDDTFYEKPLDFTPIQDSSSLGFAFPNPNKFIPQTVQLLSQKKQHEGFAFSPQLTYDQNAITLYTCEDSFYTIPKMAMELRIRSPQIQRTDARSLVLRDLYSLLANETLIKRYDDALKAGMTFAVSPGATGVDLSLLGYTETSPVLINALLSSLRDLPVEESLFLYYKDQLSEQYQKNLIACPMRAGLNKLYSQILVDTVSLEDKLNTLNTLSYEEFANFTNKLLQELAVESLALGTLSTQDLSNLLSTLSNFAEASSPYAAPSYYPQRKPLSSTKLSFQYPLSGNGMLLLEQNEDPHQYKDSVATSMLLSWIHNLYFSDLRTEQQLGYMVGSKYLEFAETPCGLFYIRSNNYSPEELVHRTQLFIQKIATDPESAGLSEEIFEQLRETYIQSILLPSSTPLAMAKKLFSIAFETKKQDFSRPDQKIAAARSMDYSYFKKYCEEFLSQKFGPEIQLLVYGANSSQEK